MNRLLLTVALLAVALTCIPAGSAQAAPVWYRISFTGQDMFNYTAGVDELYNQSAPRRLRTWVDDELADAKWTDTDGDSDGTNDFAEWAGTGLSTYDFAYFNLYGATIAPTYWDQPYHAVPDNDDGTYGVNSWADVAHPAGWTFGVVMANQSYNLTDYAFPVWRDLSADNHLTLANAGNLTFVVDVLMENPESAFEPDGTLRVWFGGFNVPQAENANSLEVSGVMIVPEPATMALLAIGGLGVVVNRLRRRK